jgi:hypothetical protein
LNFTRSVMLFFFFLFFGDLGGFYFVKIMRYLRCDFFSDFSPFKARFLPTQQNP